MQQSYAVSIAALKDVNLTDYLTNRRKTFRREITKLRVNSLLFRFEL